MKKVIIFLFVVISIMFNQYEKNTIYIPKESIRFRIIANSNTPEDQLKKMEITRDLLPFLSSVSQNTMSIDDVRNKIKDNLLEVEKVLRKYSDGFKVNFGMNYFPDKEYNSIHYKAGEYESLVITLGEGIGDNWWCILFPPLCLLEAEKDNLDDITYDFYLKEIINKYS